LLESDLMGLSIKIKTELKQLIDQEKDISMLEAIRDYLNREKMDTSLKQKLISRAEKSEADIKGGRLYSREEIENRFEKFLNR
jgi:predicted transcriptional regulator